MFKIGMFTSGYQRNPLENIFEDAKRFGASDVLFVLFGETGAATLAPAEPASLMEKLFGRKKKTGIAPSLWCPDIYDATEAQ